MDNPLYVLKQALYLRNWKMVESAYNGLTGEEPPKPFRADEPKQEPGLSEFLERTREEESLKASIVLGTEAEAQEILEQTYEEQVPQAPPLPPAPPVPAHRANLEEFRVNREPPRNVSTENGVQARMEDASPMQKNKFQDTQTLARQDIQFDKSVRTSDRVVERRPPTQKVKIICRECQKTFDVLPADLPPRTLGAGDKTGSAYVCDSCIRGKAQGRRRG